MPELKWPVVLGYAPLHQGIGARRVCVPLMQICLSGPHGQASMFFCLLPGTFFSGLHIVKAALEADAIIFAPHALPDVDCCESQFMLYMLMGLVKERYSFSIAQQYEDVTRYILSLLSTKLLIIDKQWKLYVRQIDLNLYYSIEQKSFSFLSSIHNTLDRRVFSLE